MPTTTYHDKTFGVRAIGSRTDSAGSGVTDLAAEEDRYESSDVTAGFVSPSDSFIVTADSAWNVTVGSGGSKTDIYAVVGETGQGTYIVRLDQAGDTVTISAADGSNPRKDEVYLVVEDNAYDSSGRALPRLAYREGTPAGSPSAPGPDGSWTAYILLATIDVPAAAANIGACTITDERSASQLVVDAPTLQLNSSEDFALAGHDHDSTYADIAHVNSDDGHPLATGASDGFMSASDKVKLDGIESGAEVNDSNDDVLTLLKTVDGSGSVLDADLLDGKQRSSYSTAGHTHDDRYFTESEMDSKLDDKADPGLFLHVERTSSLSIPASTISTVTFTGEVQDDWGGWSGAANAVVYDFTAGYYLVIAQAVFASSVSGGLRQLAIELNGSDDIALGRTPPASGDSTVVQAEAVVYMDGTDELRLQVYHDAAGALNLTSAFLMAVAL